MPELLYLSRADVERLLDIDSMLDALGEALVVFSSGITSVPPRAGARVGDRGILGAMPGYVPGIALEVKLVSVFPANHSRGLPSHQGLIAIFDEDSGAPLSVLAILGAGVQGGSHIETFPRIREFKEIRVASRDSGKARNLAMRHPRAM